MTVFAAIIIPAIVLGTLLCGFWKRVDCFGVFVRGAADGAKTILRIVPSLIGLFVAIGVFRASGAMDYVVGLLAPVGRFFGMEDTLLPLVLMRPVSGSASLALLEDTLRQCGADSEIGRAAAILMGSSETIFYTMAVYLGGSGIKKAPNVLAAALISNFAAALVACQLVKFL